MTNLRVRWAILVIGLLTAFWYLLPTIRYYSMTPEERDVTTPKVADLRKEAMKLGLDLQGGSYLVYEVAVDRIPEEQRTGDEIDQVIQIIRNRVDQYGVLEPVIQKQGEQRIVVQLPGLQDPARAKELVGKTARLDFLLVQNQQELYRAMSKVDEVIARRGPEFLKQMGEEPAPVGEAPTLPPENPFELPPDTLAAPEDTVAAGDTLAAAEGADSLNAPADSLLAGANPFSSLFLQTDPNAGIVYCPAENYDLARRMLDEVAGDPAEGRPAVLAGGTILLWGEREFRGDTQNPGRFLYALTSRADLTGDHIAKAQVGYNLEPTRPNAAGVLLNLNKRGAAIFTRLTGNNVGRQLAIVLDNTVMSAPVIRDKIRGGVASITGIASDAEAKDLAIVLKAGALPTDIIPQEERTVGPSLGRDSIRQGIRAALIGGGLVVVLMMLYYRVAGMLSVLALVLNLYFLFSALGMLQGTLTLPGIAGIVLTIGMAVDANVLILERIREELRNGKTVRGAIDAGYRSAFRTIVDSNLTTLISAVVLFQFGTGPIKGFATTLIIGIVANVFTAVFVTRLIYDSILSRTQLRKLSI